MRQPSTISIERLADQIPKITFANPPANLNQGLDRLSRQLLSATFTGSRIAWAGTSGQRLVDGRRRREAPK
jgi:hypothetical protein